MEWTPNASLNDQAILSDTNVLEMCTLISTLLLPLTATPFSPST